MLFSINKKTKTDKSPAIAEDITSFIPYYCHYNHHTLLTKNGELLQTIKIASTVGGLDYEGGGHAGQSAREMIRQAVVQAVSTNDVAIWLHVIRKRKPIENRGKFRESFANAVNDRWKQHYPWKFEYYNEIYVSVLYNGQSAQMLDSKNVRHITLPGINRHFRNEYLDEAAEALEGIVAGITTRIRKQFDATRLTIVERLPTDGSHPIFYSEPMEFLGTLLNLREEAFPVPQMDVSDALLTTSQTFGFNAIETKDGEGKRRFGAMLSLKQYREVDTDSVDQLLQSPMEFIISQAFHFIDSKGALAPYKEQRDIFEISGDTYCIKAAGIEDMLSSQGERDTDFGEHQTSIMVLADEFKQLDGAIAKAQEAFGYLGLITVREDLKLEECFWSQLPGNFEFLRRRDTINTTRIGGFCRLNRFPGGMNTGNHWGDAVTILPTLVNSPYFFNFHAQENGHTLLLDFNSFDDHLCGVLTNFLLTQARRFDGRTYIFDRNRSAELTFQKIGGHYHHFLPSVSGRNTAPPLALNPFQLEGTPRNQSFLLAWCNGLIAPQVRLPEAQKETLRAAIEQLYAGPALQRHLGGLVGIIAKTDAPLADAFAPWRSPGKYAGLFDAYHETLDIAQAMHAFDMNPVVENKELIVPVFSYLIHRIASDLDGKPTIIVLHEAWDLIENGFIAPRIESLMEMLKHNNAMLLFTTSRPMSALQATTFQTVMKGCATHLVLPDDVGQSYAMEGLGLTENDIRLLTPMNRQKGDFLIRQNQESIALRADLRDLDDLYVIFANDVKNLAAVMGKYANITPEA